MRARCTLTTIYSEYDQQAHYAKEGSWDIADAPEPVAIPSTQVHDAPEGCGSSAIVVSGIETLVPDVGYLLLVKAPLPDLDAPTPTVPDGAKPDVTPYWWPDVKDHFGSSLQPEPDWDPPRYRMTVDMIEEMLRECQPVKSGRG